MSLTYGFYNSINKDRLYNAEQFSSIFDGIIADGIFEQVSGRFIVSANTGYIVNVAPGRAWFNHTWTLNDSVMPIELDEPELLLDRYDAIVLEVNSLEENRENSIKIIKGEASSNPVYPELKNGNGIYQHPLAYILRHADSSEITDADIINMVGTNECPFVTGIIDTVSLDELLGQWRSQLDIFIKNETEEFLTWFDGIRDILDDNAAGHLQNEIDAISDRMRLCSGVLHTGEESITLTDPKFTNDADYEFYTSIYGVSPKTVEVGHGSITLTFDPQEIDMTVKVGVR